MSKYRKLNDQDMKLYLEATEKAWTPCKHFAKCIGLCPICWKDILMRRKEKK